MRDQEEPVFTSAYDLPVGGATSKGATPPVKSSVNKLKLMRNQIAKGNKQLFEPATPTDFKPTPEWVM